MRSIQFSRPVAVRHDATPSTHIQSLVYTGLTAVTLGVPLLVCAAGDGQTLALAVPGALTTLAAGAAGAGTGTLLGTSDLGELQALCGAMLGASVGSALFIGCLALAQNETVWRAAEHSLLGAVGVGSLMVLTSVAVAGQRSVRRTVHLPTLLTALWMGAAVTALSCLGMQRLPRGQLFVG